MCVCVCVCVCIFCVFGLYILSHPYPCYWKDSHKASDIIRLLSGPVACEAIRAGGLSSVRCWGREMNMHTPSTIHLHQPANKAAKKMFLKSIDSSLKTHHKFSRIQRNWLEEGKINGKALIVHFWINIGSRLLARLLSGRYLVCRPKKQTERPSHKAINQQPLLRQVPILQALQRTAQHRCLLSRRAETYISGSFDPSSINLSQF